MARGWRPRSGASEGSESAPSNAPTLHIQHRIWLAAIWAALIFLSVFGVLSRQRAESESLNIPTAPAPLFHADQAQDTSLMAVGRVVGLAQSCTAWLLDGNFSPQASAVAVTAGRCTGIESPATVLSEAPVSGAEVRFATFAAATSGSRQRSVDAPIREISWAGSRGMDVALLRLETTYAELASRGVRPIKVAPPVAPGTAILVTGVPTRAIPASQQHLRGSRCTSDGVTDVVEGPWVFQDLRASDCPGVLGGSGGSPAFDAAGEAVGMVVSTSVGAPSGEDCALHRPCATGSGSVDFHPNTTYLTSVQALGGCFSSDQLKLGPGCPLADPAEVLRANLGSSTVSAGTEVSVAVSDSAGAPIEGVDVQIWSGPLATTSCWNRPKGAAKVPVRAGQAAVLAPTQQGLAVFCVGSGPQPTPVVTTVVGTAPNSAAIQLDQRPVAGGVEVRPVPDPPRLVAFRWVIEPIRRADCASAEGYVEYPGKPAVIAAADLPAIVCVIGIDEAGSASAPVSIVVK